MTLPCSSNEFNFFLIVSFTFFADYNFTCTEENSQKKYSTYLPQVAVMVTCNQAFFGGGGGGWVVEWQAKGKKELLLPPKEEGKDYHLIADYWHG